MLHEELSARWFMKKVFDCKKKRIKSDTRFMMLLRNKSFFLLLVMMLVQVAYSLADYARDSDDRCDGFAENVNDQETLIFIKTAKFCRFFIQCVEGIVFLIAIKRRKLVDVIFYFECVFSVVL